MESIEHEYFGAVVEVDTRPFGQYTFTLADGQWVTIEAEEGLGTVNGASPGFPVADCDPAWAHDDGWALVVTLSAIERVPPPDRSGSRERLKSHFRDLLEPGPQD
ncbi:hypothetical protein [Actinoplanes sp. NPDC020271]|uniref:hypothetical protein n=1 Tax=Actinoplanes sp. NPDC020271 TaxID=3363896 RepID=UPI0037A78B16